MQKLISELTRLYLPAGAVSPEALAQHVQGQKTLVINLTTDEGMTRAMAITFQKIGEGEEAQHWRRLCEVANVLQDQFSFPAPAVSISGSDGYALWLSLETPVPAAQAQEFLELLRKAYFPDINLHPVSAPVELPPCMHQSTGKWAAFIHPGMGAAFADESGLEMAPPFSGQTAFLEGLRGISKTKFFQALNMLQQSHGAAPMVNVPVAERAAALDGLLLKNATLEDIVKFLHSKNIEPTFRHLILA